MIDALNARAMRLVESRLTHLADLRGRLHELPDGGRVIDLGIDAPGGLAAGEFLSRVCLADLADVRLAAGTVDGVPLPHVEIAVDHVVAACLASQYAGWAVQTENYFAMGSGPMRAAYGGEELFESIGPRDASADAIVGALETRKLPTPEVFRFLATKLGVTPRQITLLVAPTASLAGGFQIVARSVETALHKLHHLGFDLSRVVSGWGVAPLPPVAADDYGALGRTNDAILYGSTAVLWVRGDDDSLAAAIERAPSSASADHGAPFLEIFERYERDFYKVDPLLFSPARIVLHNVDTGRTHDRGRVDPRVLRRSFGL